MPLFKLPDGRDLAWDSYGAPSGAPAFYLHGAGSSRLEPAYADLWAREFGIRLLAVDRPGYGGSTPTRNPGFVSFADDLLQLADSLQLERFAAIGMSAGGPHALHVAMHAPSRITGVALINASSESAHEAWRATPLMLRAVTKLAAIRPLLRRLAAALKNDPERFCARPARSEGWNAETTRRFVAAATEGMRQPDAVDTMLEEAQRVLTQPWALDWSVLPCRVLALCGERDPGRWFYRALAGRSWRVTLVPLPGGHQPFVSETAWAQIARHVS